MHKKKKKKIIEPSLSPEEIKENKTESYLTIYSLIQSLKNGQLVLSHLLGDGKHDDNDYSCTLSLKLENGDLTPLCIILPLGVPISDITHTSREDLTYDEFFEEINATIEPLLQEAEKNISIIDDTSSHTYKQIDKKLLN